MDFKFLGRCFSEDRSTHGVLIDDTAAIYNNRDFFDNILSRAAAIGDTAVNNTPYIIILDDIYLVLFRWGIPPLQSDWSLSCDHGLDYAS